jgi:predicted SAM-dependent methyltransferase
MKPTKLNIGCGSRRLEGYTGVDAIKRPAADIIAPADKIPLKPGTIDEILAIHLVEHVHPWQTPLLLREWARLLKPGGRLVLEMPDLIKCCQNVVSGAMVGGKHPDQLGMWGLYGDPRSKDPYMAHKWAWTFATLRPLVAEAGFVDITEAPTQFHPAGREFRDFRLEAVKA